MIKMLMFILLIILVILMVINICSCSVINTKYIRGGKIKGKTIKGGRSIELSSYIREGTNFNNNILTIKADVTEISMVGVPQEPFDKASIHEIHFENRENGMPKLIIHDFTFENCTGLTRVMESRPNTWTPQMISISPLPSGWPSFITQIGNYAFYGCTSLNNVNLENLLELTLICGSAFGNCSELTHVILPVSITQIGNYAFDRCTSLNNLNFENLTNLTIIAEGAFGGCSELTHVILPISITQIQRFAFDGCTALTEININDLINLTIIGADAFDGCTALTEININNLIHLTTIGNHAFRNCTGLTTVIIPTSITTIGDGAFSGCSNITVIVLPGQFTTHAELLRIGINPNSPNIKTNAQRKKESESGSG
jgi:hypothetical protein